MTTHGYGPFDPVKYWRHRPSGALASEYEKPLGDWYEITADEAAHYKLTASLEAACGQIDELKTALRNAITVADTLLATHGRDRDDVSEERKRITAAARVLWELENEDDASDPFLRTFMAARRARG